MIREHFVEPEGGRLKFIEFLYSVSSLLTSEGENSSLIEVWITAEMWTHQLKVLEACAACKHRCKHAFSRACPAQQSLYWVFGERRSSKAALINGVQCVFPTPAPGAHIKDCSEGWRDDFKNLHEHTNKHKHGLAAQMDLYVWMHRGAHRGWNTDVWLLICSS